MSTNEKDQLSAEEKARQREEDLKRLQGFRLMDDDFMTAVFAGQIEATTLLISIILKRTDLTVVEVLNQLEIKNANGRSVRLDIVVEEADGTRFDIEIQREDRGAIAQRARYNGSLLDTKMLKPGDKFKVLQDRYVIFITENDVRKEGRPVYLFGTTDLNNHKPMGDGAYYVYVNGAYHNDSDDIGKLVHDFWCTSADDMYYPELAERVRYLKETEGGQEQMCRAMEQLREESMERGEYKARKEMALKMLADGVDVATVAKYTQFPNEEVEELAKQV